MEPGILLLQLAEAGVDVLGGAGGGVGALFFKAQGDALLPVQAGIGFVPVVRQGHNGHILQPDGVHAVHAGVEEQQIFQHFQVGDFLAHGYHVADTVLGDVARGHVEALGFENTGDHIHGEDVVQIGLGQGILTAGFNGIQAAVHLGQGGIHLGGVGGQVRHGTAHLQQAGGLLLAENPGGILQLQHTAVQLGNHILLQVGDSLIHLGDVLLQLRDLAAQQADLHTQVRQLLLGGLNGGFDVCNVVFQLCNPGIQRFYFSFFHALLQ